MRLVALLWSWLALALAAEVPPAAGPAPMVIAWVDSSAAGGVSDSEFAAGLKARIAGLERRDQGQVLVVIAARSSLAPTWRDTAYGMIEPLKGSLARADVDALLRIDDFRQGLFLNSLFRIAPFQQVSPETITFVIERYKGEQGAGNHPHYFAFFTRLRQETQADQDYFLAIRKLIAPFVVSAAKVATDNPINLRPFIGQCLYEWKLPGAAEVLSASIMDGLKRHAAKRGTGSALGAMSLLAKITKRPLGVTGSPPQPEEIAKAAYDWIAWWERECNRPGYALPHDANDVPDPVNPF